MSFENRPGHKDCGAVVKMKLLRLQSFSLS